MRVWKHNVSFIPQTSFVLVDSLKPHYLPLVFDSAVKIPPERNPEPNTNHITNNIENRTTFNFYRWKRKHKAEHWIRRIFGGNRK